ncbi:hypothetical protein GY45DRAFT_1039613 [Cubamyces sp. BRFM 1775]|nr:hypothetical protein GY45DRAFT_1039613 [Cubamyces sp. BRFM 1775]
MNPMIMPWFQTQFTQYPIPIFFAQFPGFVYNPTICFIAQFQDLDDMMGWSDSQRERARKLLRKAMVLQFIHIYGTDPDSLAAWQLLCWVLRIFPIPNSIPQCRKRVYATHVNICDLLMLPWQGLPPLFPSELALSTYTKSTQKIFPRKSQGERGFRRATHGRIRFLRREHCLRCTSSSDNPGIPWIRTFPITHMP